MSTNKKDLIKKITYQRKNFWQEYDKTERQNAFVFCDPYRDFIGKCKTERETIAYFKEQFKIKGFSKFGSENRSKKYYAISRNKSGAFAVIGNKPISEGINLIVSHIDSPRVDLKQNPLSEDNETKLGLMKTHYYGGVKKYQWFSTPLALHGTFVKDGGEVVSVSIGDEDDDPVFVMPDLLPHLAHKEQYSKKIGDAIDASKMNLIFNSIPYIDEEETANAVKLNALLLLHEKYGICEEQFLSAELELVPAGKARDAGLDKSMILGYGQDDRVCAYTSAQALLDLDENKLDKTAIVYLADKEEIGSEGNTGAKSAFIIDFIADLLKQNDEKSDSTTLRKTLLRSHIISADVNAAINPNFPTVHEKDNAVHLGFGVSITKYTGSRGKGGSNDANAEFNARLISVFNKADVNWQTGALGKVDEGGGGTIAKFMAEHGAEVIDCGPGVLGMHSLYELTSKADIYSTYKGYKAFFEYV